MAVLAYGHAAMSRSRLSWSFFVPLSILACGDDGAPPSDTEADSSTAADDGGPGTTVGMDTSSTTPTDDTTTDTPATDSGSTGPVFECGNEVVEAGEECDDGNADNGDACYSNCTIAYEIAWTQSIHGGAADDLSFEVVTDDAGNLYLGGWSDADVADADVWIQQVTPDGRLGWSYTYAGAAGGDDTGFALAWAGTDLVIVGVESMEMGGEDGLVVRVDPSDQSTVWAVQFDGPSESEFGDRISDVAIAPDGTIVVAGTMSVDDSELDGWVAKLDADGALLWENTFAGTFGDQDGATGVGVDGDGNVHAVGYDTLSMSMIAGWHRSYDADGNETGADALGYIANDIAVAADGTIVVAGRQDSDTGFVDGVVYAYDAAFAEQWVAMVDGPAGDFDALNGVIIGADGDIYAAGSVLEVNRQDNYWAGRFSASGELLWSDIYNNDRLDIQDIGLSMALDAEGNAIAVGRENQLGMGLNAFVRKYVQAAPPR
jgi:cysteine-rich repeat protein